MNQETEEKTIDRKLILSLLATGIMSFSSVIVETAMNVTFPTLMEEFHIGTSTVQWITTGYLLVLAAIIPASSYLKKRFPMKGIFLTAICLFITGTVMAAAAPAGSAFRFSCWRWPACFFSSSFAGAVCTRRIR